MNSGFPRQSGGSERPPRAYPRAMEHRWIRWAPAVLVPVALAAAVIVTPLAAGATDLPVKSPSDVLRLVAASDTRSFSGTVEQTMIKAFGSVPGSGK